VLRRSLHYSLLPPKIAKDVKFIMRDALAGGQANHSAKICQTETCIQAVSIGDIRNRGDRRNTSFHPYTFDDDLRHSLSRNTHRIGRIQSTIARTNL
jgi:hypothetical protein